MELKNRHITNSLALSSGAVAGLAVDLTLYPLDTMKTRLQSQQGFKSAGGFSKIYAGVPAVAVGSAPGSAVFFFSYELSKRHLERVTPHPTLAHMTAATFGELTACLIRVPTEVFKQRAQATPGISTMRLVVHGLANDGLIGCYRGYWSTVGREIPFSFVEFPLWEFLKRSWSTKQDKPCTPIQTAVCGSVAGAVAAGLTTPLDVAKTRIMLSRKTRGDRSTIRTVLADIYRTKGYRGVYAGFWPRVIWMALGGFVFFGAYEKSMDFFRAMNDKTSKEYLSISGLSLKMRDLAFRLFDLFYDDEKLKNEPKTFDDVLKESDEFKEKTRVANYRISTKRR